jgi:hypothetical protein
MIIIKSVVTAKPRPAPSMGAGLGAFGFDFTGCGMGLQVIYAPSRTRLPLTCIYDMLQQDTVGWFPLVPNDDKGGRRTRSHCDLVRTLYSNRQARSFLTASRTRCVSTTFLAASIIRHIIISRKRSLEIFSNMVFLL